MPNPFVSFAFPVTGGTKNRTMPERLADKFDVKDFGAIGNGTVDDRASIQSAIDVCITTGAGGGTVEFPQGTYRVNGPLQIGHATIDCGVRLEGSAKGGTTFVLDGSYTDPGGIGFVVSKGTRAIDCLEGVFNMGGGFSIRGTRRNVMVMNCNIGAGGVNQVGCDVHLAQSAIIRDCAQTGNTQAPEQAVAGHIPGATPGSIGIAMGTGIVTGVRGGNGAEICVAMSGRGSILVSSSFETCGSAVRVGWAPTFMMTATATSANILTFASVPRGLGIGRGVTGTNIPSNTTITAIDFDTNRIFLSANTTGSVTAVTFGNEAPTYGAVVIGLQTERVMRSIDLYNVHGGYIAGNALTGGGGTAHPEQIITGASWLTGIATVTTATNHNIVSGAKVQLFVDNSGANANWTWVPDNVGGNAANSVGYTHATVASPNTFTYPLSTSPAPFVVRAPNDGPAGADVRFRWTYPLEHAIRCRKVYDTVISAHQISVATASASVDLDWDGEADANNNIVENVTAPMGWTLPTDATNLASWRFESCRGTTTKVFADSLPVPMGQMVFANLPGESGVKQDRLETQEFDLKDVGAVSLGSNVTVGGGSNHYRVRWNGTAWVRNA